MIYRQKGIYTYVNIGIYTQIKFKTCHSFLIGPVSPTGYKGSGGDIYEP